MEGGFVKTPQLVIPTEKVNMEQCKSSNTAEQIVIEKYIVTTIQAARQNTPYLPGMQL